MASLPPMRFMAYTRARNWLIGSCFASVGVWCAIHFGYTRRRYKKYVEFFANYDPYERMREICSHGPGIMVSCPQDLAKLYEEKGKKVAPF